jgi:hypothetical protein
VPVAAGTNVPGIDGHLHHAGSIAGTVTAAAGGTITVVVAAYLGSTPVTNVITDSLGHYLIGGLSPSSAGYAVCVQGGGGYGGNSTTGYLGRCYKTAAYNGGPVPPAATRIPLAAGQHKVGVNITLENAGAIAGKIADITGAGLGNVDVFVTSLDTGTSLIALTASNGTYRVAGLPPMPKGYAVCANPSFDATGTTGYRPRCFKDTAWDGGTTVPAGATPVDVSAGHTHASVNIKLPVGAAISGNVVDAKTGDPLADAEVRVYSSTGNLLGDTLANAQGRYVVKGLAASASNHVCVYPLSSGTPGVSHMGECWKNVPWDGTTLPAGLTNVGTTLGQTHTGIAFRLSKVTVALGSIAGTLTEHAGGNPLEGVYMYLYASASGNTVAFAITDASGNYAFTGLHPDADGYEICAKPVWTTVAPALPSNPVGGWAPRCYGDSPWIGIGPPSGAASLPLSPGQHKSGIDISLHGGASISGTTTAFGGGTPVGNVEVDVYEPDGTSLAFTRTDSTTGTYAFADLLPSGTGYVVCFDGRAAVLGGAGYLPQCWHDQTWSGKP